MRAWHRALVSVNLLLLGVILPAEALAAPADQKVSKGLQDRALAEGEVRVLVELVLPSGRVAENTLARQAVAGYRQEISDTASRVLGRLANYRYRVLRRYQSSPFVAVSVDASAL